VEGRGPPSEFVFGDHIDDPAVLDEEMSVREIGDEPEVLLDQDHREPALGPQP